MKKILLGTETKRGGKPSTKIFNTIRFGEHTEPPFGWKGTRQTNRGQDDRLCVVGGQVEDTEMGEKKKKGLPTKKPKLPQNQDHLTQGK